MGWITDPITVQAKGGRVFTSGSGSLLLTTATGGSVLLSNPVGTGKRLYLFRVVLCAESKIILHAEMRYNPTTALPTGVQSISNVLIGGSSSIATVKSEPSASLPSGGQTGMLGFHVPVTGIADYTLPPIIVPPGNSVCIIFPKIATLITCDLYWFEDI